MNPTPGNPRKSRAPYYLILAVPVVAVFFLIPFELYYSGREYWNWNRVVPLSFTATGALIYLAAVIATWILFRINEKVAASFIITLFWLGAFVLLADVFAPLQSTPLDGSELKSTEPLKYTFIEAGIFIGILIAALRLRHSIVPVAAFASSLLVVISAVYLALIVSTGRPNTEIAGSRVADHGIRGNVYHILLDEMQTDMALLYIKENALEKNFTGFTVFKNNISNYLYTNGSLPSYITGTVYTGGSFKDWARSYSVRGLFKDMHDKGYSGTFYSPAGHWCNPYLRCIVVDDIFRQFKGAAATEFTDFVQIWFARILPNIVTGEALYAGKRLGNDIIRLAGRGGSGNFPVSKSEGIDAFSSVLMLNRLIEDENERPSHGQYIYAHALLPHLPYIMDENCGFSLDLRSAGAEGYYEQAGCALNLTVRFLENLRRLGRYDDATIIIHGDTGHGYLGFIRKKGQTMVETAGLEEGFSAFIPQVSLWSENQLLARASSLLMIKPARDTGDMRLSDRLSQLIDLYPTLAGLLGLGGDASDTAGLPLFEENFPAEREASFFLYEVNSLDPYEIVRVKISKQENLQASSLVVADSLGIKDIPDFPGEGVAIDIGSEDEGHIQLTGFSIKEQSANKELNYRWSTGNKSTIALSGLKLSRRGRMFVTFEVSPSPVNENEEMILKTALSSASVTLRPGLSEYGVVLDFPAGKFPMIDVSYLDAASPASLGTGREKRDLAVLWNSISIKYASENFPASGLSYDIGSEDENGLRLEGFSGKEKQGAGDSHVAFRWATGKQGRIAFGGLGLTENRLLIVKLKAAPFAVNIHSEMLLKTPLSQIRVTLREGWSDYLVALDFPAGENPALDIEYEDAASPASLGTSRDRRNLAVRWSEIGLELAPPNIRAAGNLTPKRIEVYKLGERILFNGSGNSRQYQTAGWSVPEGEFTWTDSEKASLSIPITASRLSVVTLEADLSPFLVPGKVDGQAVRVLVNGRKAGTWNITKQGFQEQTLKIPASLLTDPYSLKLTFELPDAVSPAAVGYNQDRRVLGLAFRSLRLSDE